MQPNDNLEEFLAQAKSAVENTAKLTAELKDLDETIDKNSRSIRKEREKLEETKKTTVSKRRSEVSSTFDKELSVTNEKLKKAKSEREKAKNEGIRTRISSETQGFHSNIRGLRTAIKDTLRQNQVPGVCGWNIFYTLYYPSSLRDYLILVAAFVIFLLAIPYLIFLILGSPAAWVLVLLFAGCLIIFGGLYVAGFSGLRLKYDTVLRYVITLRKQIREQEKNITKRTKDIRKDTDEGQYGLASYDDEIAHIQQEMADITMKKNSALESFDNVTKNIILDEIDSNTLPAINQHEEELKQLIEKRVETENARKNSAIYSSNNFEVYLGREFMTVEKIDALADIVSHGTASNISEAIEEYRNRSEI